LIFGSSVDAAGVRPEAQGLNVALAITPARRKALFQKDAEAQAPGLSGPAPPGFGGMEMKGGSKPSSRKPRHPSVLAGQLAIAQNDASFCLLLATTHNYSLFHVPLTPF
jgi:hypothetical protein